MKNPSSQTLKVFLIITDNIYLKINDNPIANVRFYQQFFRVGHDITGQILTKNDSNIFKVKFFIIDIN